MKFKILIISLKTTAIILLGINFIGFFMPLRNSEIYAESNTFFKNDIGLTEEQLLEILSQKNGSDKDFAIKANDAINKGIAHFWMDEGIDKYNLRVPIFENYILYLASYTSPASFMKYEFSDYQLALERGVGLCSQHSIILSEILKKNNIDSKIIGLSGHVVVMANIDKKNSQYWVLDPDYGVVIEHSISQIEKEPEIIRMYYAQHGYSNEDIMKLIDIYGPDGNFITDGVREYSGNNKYYFEKISYVAIWVIPFLILCISYTLERSMKPKSV
ncbi:hypothetical protein [Winogradskyella bathintestinalis]|uniref:Transglutaminase-like domain-containing protein n=1 Tax=Winogradskyella bathintestinalis TaxID=3035208 RepID=A0ABT7ZYD2_9FLAO|nr:hypothetical protein [Winogradskyella bathintestinalis]MDN3493748.1 hypothetical protein [Winogradskyella bathintestinalis]